MKKHLSIALISLMALSANLSAEDKAGYNVTGSAAITSNYIWRGISYTDGTATGQAGFDLNNVGNVEGFHINFWGSGIMQGSEIDAVIGYEMAVNDDISLDMGAINYYYTQDRVVGTFAGGSYAEAFIVASYSDFALSYYREIGYGDTSDYNGNTFMADASFGAFDINLGTRNTFETDSFAMYFGSVGVNWECLLMPGVDANFMVAYNNAFTEVGGTNTLFGIDDTEGATASLTFSKSF